MHELNPQAEFGQSEYLSSQLLVCGLNHHTAAIPIRERVAITPQETKEFLDDLKHDLGVSEAAVLSTCNRTEIYACNTSPDSIIAWLADYHGFLVEELKPHLYVHESASAIRHMLRVASGLDSMVLGETQILSQLKTAFSKAQEGGSLGPTLQRLFQYIFSSAKTVRRETGIGQNAISIAYYAVQLSKHLFSDLKQVTALLIGAGNTISLVAKYLAEAPVKELLVANRSHHKAQEQANLLNGKGIRLEELPYYLHQADLIFSATQAPLPIIGKGMVEQALKLRRNKPIFMIDLALPRDIEPQVAELSDVYLYNIEDLLQVIQKNLQDRYHAAEHAEKLIQAQVDAFVSWQKSLSAVETIRALREKMEDIKQIEVGRALKQLSLGKSPEETLLALANRLGNKWIHMPTVKLREAGYSEEMEILACAQWLFDL